MKFLRLLQRIPKEIRRTMDTASVIKDPDRFYERVFAKVETRFSVSLDPDTISSIIGFSAGGLVSLRVN